MLNLFKLKLLFLTVSVCFFIEVNAQYKYTRYSIDVSAGPSYPKTSIPGILSGYGELGFKGTLSRYLSLRASGGYGTASGSRDVTQMIGTPESVDNYTKYNTTYIYFTGSAHINLEKLLHLRKENGKFLRTNPFLVIGSGMMFPDIKVNRFDGQVKNYKSNLRFVTHNIGLDFTHFLSNRFDLLFGVEYRFIQSYYFDGAFADKKLDGLYNAHVGISYNIGASSDKKHMDWYNLDGKTDVFFAPEEQKTIPEPISQTSPKDTAALAAANRPVDTAEDTTDYAAAGKAVAAEEDKRENIELAEGLPSVKNTDTVTNNTAKVTPPVNTTTPAVAANTPKTPRKVGRHVDLKPGTGTSTTEPKAVVMATTETKADEPTPSTTFTQETSDSNLNSIDGVVRPLGKYNVIVATYSGTRYAYVYRNQLRKQGFQAALFKSSERSKMVRVAVYYGDNKNEALKQLRSYRSKFGGQVWIHVYDPQ